MKICVLVSSEDQIEQAGARIRYRRIQPLLNELGHELRLVPIQQATSNYDVYVISKCFDVRSLVLARALAGRRPVGVDIFDDYFSQNGDSRLTVRRQWLRTMSTLADFALCSTPSMRCLLEDLLPQTPIHILSDPCPPVDPGGIGGIVERKLTDLHESMILNVAWFGMGDNPLFSVGLKDLADFGSELRLLRARGWDTRLRILTNTRAMSPALLSTLQRLPVRYTLDAWSEEKEVELLNASLAAFLPVNAQNFSIVKSLNRAITALCSGTQVLSTGYPLYQSLSPFIYRDPAQLLNDIDSHTLALRQDTTPHFATLIDQVASPSREARSLAEFLLARCDRRSSQRHEAFRPLAAVLHGRVVRKDTHMFIQRMGGLSVAGPLCRSEVNFDVSFLAGTGGRIEILIAERWHDSLASEAKTLLSPVIRRGSASYYLLKFTDVPHRVGRLGAILRLLGEYSPCSPAYMGNMQLLCEIIEFLFPSVSCYYSDDSLSFGLSGIFHKHENGTT